MIFKGHLNVLQRLSPPPPPHPSHLPTPRRNCRPREQQKRRRGKREWIKLLIILTDQTSPSEYVNSANNNSPNGLCIQMKSPITTDNILWTKALTTGRTGECIVNNNNSNNNKQTAGETRLDKGSIETLHIPISQHEKTIGRNQYKYLYLALVCRILCRLFLLGREYGRR